MKRILAILLLSIPLTGCGTLGKMFSGGGDAKRASLQALVTTTRTAKLLVTAAAIAADAGAISEPQWRKIASASVRAGNALQSWSDALRAGKDASEFQAIVDRALAVIEALMPEPEKHSSSLVLPFPVQPATFATLTRPDSLRHRAA